MESVRQSKSEQPAQPAQPAISPAAVVASGLASATVAVLTPYLPLEAAGELVAALISMSTTALSAIYAYLVRDLDESAPRLGVWVLLVGAIACLIGIGAVTGFEAVGWVLLIGVIICLIGIGAVIGVKVAVRVLVAGAITCLIGIGSVTGFEVGVGETLPCWLGEKVKPDLGGDCSGNTQPSILGGASNDSELYWDDTADGDGIGAGDPVEYALGAQPSGWVTRGGDNCPDVANRDQKDTDGNGTGDACTPVETAPFYFDADGDGVGSGDPMEYVPGMEPPDWVTLGGDNCPYNPSLLDPYYDIDGDGVGDTCDAPPGPTTPENTGVITPENTEVTTP